MEMISYTSRDKSVSIERDFDSLPRASQVGLASLGMTHVFASQVAAIVTGRVKAAIAEYEGIEAKDVTTDQIKEWRKANAESVAQFQQAAIDSKLAAIDNGESLVREAGEGAEEVDPVASEMRKLAKAAILKILDANGLKFPTRSKGSDGKMQPERLQLPDGAFTGAELIARQIARNEVALRKQAEAIVKLRDKAQADGEGLAAL